MTRVWDVIIWGLALLILAWFVNLFNAEFQYQTGLQDLKNGRDQAARSRLEQAVEKLPANCRYRRSLAQAIAPQVSTKPLTRLDYQLSWEQLEKATELCPHYPYLWFEAGLSLINLQRITGNPPREPADYIDRALEIDPGNPRFMAGKIYLLLNQGQMAEARKMFLQLATISPESIEVFAPALLTEPEQKDDFLIQLGKSPDALSTFVLYLAGRGDLERARRGSAMLPEAERNDPRFVFELSGDYLRNQDDKEAVAILVEAVRFHPADPSINSRLAGLEMRRGDYEGAIKHLTPAFKANPNHLGLAQKLARSAQAVGDYNLAMTTYGKILNMEGITPATFKQCHEARAELRYESGDYEGAINEYMLIFGRHLEDSETRKRVEEIKQEQWEKKFKRKKGSAGKSPD